LPVFEAEKELDRPISRDGAMNHGETADRELLLEIGAKRRRQIGHFSERERPLLIKPLPNLPATVDRLLALGEIRLKLGQAKIFDVALQR
jgi:hypothetical protein